MDVPLIYDVGAHDGDDTAFYLKKGFSVVAIEASPELCSHLHERFAREVASKTLRILNLAIAEKAGEVTLYINDRLSIWNTTTPEFEKRNAVGGAPSSRRIKVPSAPLDSVIREYGVPYYVKIDIEGQDMAALHSLERLTEKPLYLSMEAEKSSWAKLLEEFSTLRRLGYRRFKLMNQALLEFQDCPNPPLVGKYVDHRFTSHSSGLFGEETPGVWLDASKAIEQYQHVFLGYLLHGDDGIFRTSIMRGRGIFDSLIRLQKKVANFRGQSYADPFDMIPHAYWYDTHATR